MRTNIVLAILLPLILHTRPVCAQSLGLIPPPGTPLPQISLPLPDGTLMTTNDLLGKRTVVHVFASW